MTNNEAIKTIRKCFELISLSELNPDNYSDDEVCELNSAVQWAAIYGRDALDQLEAESNPQEPSEDTRAWALDTARGLWIETCKGGCSPAISSEVWAMRLFALITDRDERIRRECADRADHEVAGWLAGCQRRLLRVAILGTEPAREESE